MNIFDGVILSSWNYIMGPQIEKLWLVDNCDANSDIKVNDIEPNIIKDINMSKTCNNIQLDLNSYQLMCGQLLLSEVDTTKPFEENVSRFYLSNRRILSSIVFQMDSLVHSGDSKPMKNVCLCLGLMMRFEGLTFALDNKRLIDLQLRKIVNVLQTSKDPQHLSLIEVSKLVEEFLLLLNSLHHKNLGCTRIPVHMSFEGYLKSKVVLKAVVSHLQTSGHSVIIGGSEFIVHQLLYILSMFNKQKEVQSSLPISCLPSRPYHQGLYLQGTMKNDTNKVDFLLNEAAVGTVPLTVIDADWCKVWQTFALDGAKEKNKNVMQVVTETGTLIPQLISDLAFLEKTKADTTKFVENFCRHLMSKAVSLIKLIEGFSHKGKLPNKKELMTLLGLSTVADLQIILGFAEKIKPKIRNSVFS